MTEPDLAACMPALILVASALVATLLALPARVSVRFVAWAGAAACVGAGVTALALGPGAPGLGGAIARDGPSVFFASLAAAGAAGVCLLAAADPRRARRSADEIALVLFSASGAIVLASAADLLVLVVGLVLLTLPASVLAGRTHPDEDGARHVLLGATSSAVATYGVALLYAPTGET